MALLAAVAGSACNGQFDFDTRSSDAGAPPIIITIDTGTGIDEPTPSIDAVADAPRTGVHIACGASDCVTPGCCSTTADLSCVDVADGGTCGGLLIQCDDTDDCLEGEVCCAEGDNRALATCPDADACPNPERLQRVHCETEAHCRGSFVVLCNPDRPSPCTQCVESSLPGLPPGYHQCAATP
jgi:hypothetical protein